LTNTISFDPTIDVSQEQNQTQTQNNNLPLVVDHGVLSASGSKLPKTGQDAAAVGGMATISLAAGISLMEFARRRRRHWFQPAGVPMAIEIPVVSRPEPDPTGSEVDLLLPYTQTDRPGPGPADPITPSF
jgi:hypothetical protein